jgi:hypothetical protein
MKSIKSRDYKNQNSQQADLQLFKNIFFKSKKS